MKWNQASAEIAVAGSWWFKWIKLLKYLWIEIRWKKKRDTVIENSMCWKVTQHEETGKPEKTLANARCINLSYQSGQEDINLDSISSNIKNETTIFIL